MTFPELTTANGGSSQLGEIFPEGKYVFRFKWKSETHHVLADAIEGDPSGFHCKPARGYFLL